MVSPERFCINSSKITHETIDGEVVIVNLASGTYYSLDGPGADIWYCIGTRASIVEIAEYIAHRYDGEAAGMMKAVAQLVGELQTEGLIMQDSDESRPDHLESLASLPSPADQNVRSPFSPPTLQKYTDMQDLLLLDPIHDVDEAGWPTVKQEAKNTGGKV